MGAHLRLEGEKIHLDRKTLEALATLEPLVEPVRAYLALHTADTFFSGELKAIATRLRALVLPKGRWVPRVLEVANGLCDGAADWADSGVCKDGVLRFLSSLTGELGNWAEMLDDYGHIDYCDWLLGEQRLLRKLLKGVK